MKNLISFVVPVAKVGNEGMVLIGSDVCKNYGMD